MGEALDLSSLGSFEFAPSWATKENKVKIGKISEHGRDRGGHAERGEKRSDERKQFGEKKPFGDKRQFGEKKPFKKRFEGRARFEDRPKPLEAEVKVLPETKALGTIFRKIQGDNHAFKLKDLAYFFLDNPSSVLLRVQLKGEEKFYQCKACGFASNKESDVIEHIMTSHLDEYFDAKEIETEPPKGNFNCVAKCGLSGVLLGPPNIHEFNSVVKEMIRTKYPDMSEQQYRAHIEMVRDAEAIEEWRKGAIKKTVYFAKGTADTEGAVNYTREQAEGEFKRNYLTAMVDQPKVLMITVEQATKSPVRQLQWLANDALAEQRRAPYSMIFALRGAFHHRKLNFFRANDSKGPEFVLNQELKEFDAEHAIPELSAVAKFLLAHPCLDKGEFPADIADFEKHLNWLVTTGHAVAFTNGVYSAVEKFPKYGPQWKKRNGSVDSKTEASEVTEAKVEEVEVKAEETEVKTEVTEAKVEEPKTEAPIEVKEEEKQDEATIKLAE